MITPTQQIVCSIVSRQLIADLSPTSRQPVDDQSQPISNQLAINRSPVVDRSPTGRRFLGIVVADQSPICNRKTQFLIAHCIGGSWFLVARQSPTGCSACVTGALYELIDPVKNKWYASWRQSIKEWHLSSWDREIWFRNQRCVFSTETMSSLIFD